MSYPTWLAYFAAAWLISLSPGAGAVSCMAAGMRYGYRRAVWNIFGLQLGILFVLGIVAGGLGAILAASDTAFTLVKWVGALYLVWLGIQQWRAPVLRLADGDGNGAAAAAASPRDLLVRGFAVNATNPKGILFMLAVLPQFIDPAKPQALQYAICGITLFFTDAVVMTGYTLFASRALAMLRSERQQRFLNRVFGGLFIVAGSLLATFRRVVSI